MSEKTEDNFEKGIFWELYQDLERQFQNFLEYVPYLPGNETVYSFKLLNLILSIGGHVDSAFKEMARYPEFSNDEECQEILRILKKSEERKKEGKAPIPVSIRNSLKVFERQYELSKKIVIFKRLPDREDVTPFKPVNPETHGPEWWEVYNELKHDVGVNIEKANMRVTLDALAGAFLLNVIHTPAYLRLIEYRIVKPELTGRVTYSLGPGWREKMKEWVKKKRISGVVQTPLFIYNYEEQER